MLKNDKYEVVIGLEIHAQLKTKSKAFCGDEVSYGDAPNTKISAVSLGHPGTLPVHNKEAINMAIMLGLACDSDITEFNKYSRKNYFYADLPKGYQITQFDNPICEHGAVEITLPDGTPKTIHLTRIHMEEDTGKSLHDLDIENTLMDYNRAGTPLVEIVTEPDLRSGDEAYAFLMEVRRLVRYLGVCDGNMEEGSLRCDANISIRPLGQKEFGTKVEVKNMNSMSNVKRAIEHEFERQCEMADNGEEIFSETRSFDAMKGTTFSMRSKEMINDYRFFPEPDLPPLIVKDDWIASVRSKMPPLPKELFKRFTGELNLSDYDAGILTESKEIADFFLKVCDHTKNYKAAANWVMGAVKGWINSNASHIEDFSLSAATIADIIASIDEGTINFSVAEQKLFPALIETPTKTVSQLIEELNLALTGDDDTLQKLVDEVLAAFPDKVAEYKAGKTGLLGMFMGQIMKKSGGKADPKKTNQLLAKALS
ncbi:MAG: Asp-tRNA(Asn)/Glu-tRNA(Gln) amidotransferase subunit GatB [Bacteroidia bacterium]|nr:Asp-tRNA(Asn)/Glu-tRNA(Gln) amidotransferase subunit GatB [Bacteroidia bacterium]NNJ55542.1 Asp-tRNA(Asn)/Glu-tRNA(Gln) amidotransferase subunit GatB [Bacteroidia bacterium]